MKENKCKICGRVIKQQYVYCYKCYRKRTIKNFWQSVAREREDYYEMEWERRCM
jgi:hypothetical protein